MMADVGVGDSNISSMVDNVPGLSEEEKTQLMSVMIKAKELDAQEENKMRQPLEGQLFKYTNVVKGWQYRWFVLNPDMGTFEYYMLDEIKKGRPRGAVHLAGGVISPSEEDGQMFTVSSACGEVYKLRGHDAKERQIWINRLRKVAEDHTKTIAQKNPPLLPREIRGPHDGAPSADKGGGASSASSSNQTVWYVSGASTGSTACAGSAADTTAATTPAEAFTSVREILGQVGKLYQTLAMSIEALPGHGPGHKFYDRDMLVLKATSCATVICLEQCLAILQEHKAQQSNASSYASWFGSGTNIDWIEPSSTGEPDGSEEAGHGEGSRILTHVTNTGVAAMTGNNSGEVSDAESEEDDGHIPTEAHKEDILQLLSTLKLGMDLTKVSLPSYVLEPRSLLEVYANFMSQSELFLWITDGQTADERMVRVMEWFLCSLYATRKSLSARKPYNPVLGETFHCSWRAAAAGDFPCQVTFVAEQVSHQPPVSAFYVECLEKKMMLQASLGVKANFVGNYVGVQFLGEVELCLVEHGETYTLGLPTLYCRSLLSQPYLELGGRVHITCHKMPNAGATITFHTKPFYGGKLHSVSGEARSSSGEVVCKVSGEWDGCLEFEFSDGTTRKHDVQTFDRSRKRCRPLDAQDTCESRKLWQHVTRALAQKDYAAAACYKLQVEEKQRELNTKRKSINTAQETKLFHVEGTTWRYKYPLETSS
ncbi:oxysterol-binding protein-related protein 11-like isoform X2 [Ornithodoros turicata]|uniref:oxysterol-binding protein-related protein 11-like isoform X2 n=1 Tax=Ornithodoros turicata TaxID=34597 RepID=UPI003139AD0C